MLDGNHHSGSFCDFLEAIKKTHKVSPKTSQDPLEFYLAEQILIKMTDIVLSYTELKKKKKKKIKSFQEHTDSHFGKK